MPKLTFDVSLELLTWDDLIFLQEDNKSWRYMRDLAARFLVGENGQPVDEGQARKLLGALPEGEAKQVVGEVIVAIGEARKAAVNPTNAG